MPFDFPLMSFIFFFSVFFSDLRSTAHDGPSQFPEENAAIGTKLRRDSLAQSFVQCPQSRGILFHRVIR